MAWKWAFVVARNEQRNKIKNTCDAAAQILYWAIQLIRRFFFIIIGRGLRLILFSFSHLQGRDVEIERMEEVSQTLRSSLAAQSETLSEVRSQSSYLSSRLQDSLTTNSMAQKDFKTKADQLNENV